MKHKLKILFVTITITVIIAIGSLSVLIAKSRKPLPTEPISTEPVSQVAVSKNSSKQISALLSQAKDLNADVLKHALIIYDCTTKLKIRHRNYLVLVDFAKPSNQKRLWLFNLDTNKLLYHSLVAHGVNSGLLYATQFSNRINSRMSSIGLYKTGIPYQGGVGHALKLHGQEPGYNDKAFQRTVVMHGAWYVSEDFAKKYGRIGRSWGCPAVTQELAKPIIDAIGNGALLLIYYPDKSWLINSRFLHCR